MAKMSRLEADNSGEVLDRETAATLAAIDEGRKDALSGRVVSGQEVRKNLSDWATPSSTRKQHSTTSRK